MNKREAKAAASFTKEMLELMNGHNGAHWTKRVLSDSTNWLRKKPSDGKRCFCLVGAAREIRKRRRYTDSAYRTYMYVLDTLEEKIDKKYAHKDIPAFNDNRKTRWVHVKKLLTDTIKEFEKLASA